MNREHFDFFNDEFFILNPFFTSGEIGLTTGVYEYVEGAGIIAGLRELTGMA